ncbi:hypothetical protein [Ferrovibrio sp.]|uniref:hypothetical protein n=1 Tax=Ferrovibrio sp. TaxID=1917215 RepID=UPI00311E4EEB
MNTLPNNPDHPGGGAAMTVIATIRQAITEQPADVRQGVELLFQWGEISRRPEQSDYWRIAYLVGLGHSPGRAAARELGYRLARAFDARQQRCCWGGGNVAG